MSNVRVKICGINDPAAFDTAVAAGADYVGFVFFPPSPRNVTPAQAAALSARHPAAGPPAGHPAGGLSGRHDGAGLSAGHPAAALSAQRPAPALSTPHIGGPLRVGLFVGPTAAAIEAVLAAIPLDVLQVYGPVDVPALRARFGLPVWHAIGVDAAADLPREAGGADALVLEAKPPPAATRPGGNATRFDWSLLRDWTAPAPWVLAGGLTPDNVTEAIRATGATTVDVSSGVEIARGVKDPALIRQFINLARASGNGMPPDACPAGRGAQHQG
jgi:phosphoribosylanthranilate isomerase